MSMLFLKFVVVGEADEEKTQFYWCLAWESVCLSRAENLKPQETPRVHGPYRSRGSEYSSGATAAAGGRAVGTAGGGGRLRPSWWVLTAPRRCALGHAAASTRAAVGRPSPGRCASAPGHSGSGHCQNSRPQSHPRPSFTSPLPGEGVSQEHPAVGGPHPAPCAPRCPGCPQQRP